MFETLFDYFRRKFPLTEQEEMTIKRAFHEKSLKKGEFLQQPGDTLKYGAFVAEGFLRSYVVDPKGKEHIIQFAPENWWISDKAGMSTDGKATFFIDAIEDSGLLLVDLQGHLSLMQTVPGYAASFQAGMQKRAYAKDTRIENSLTATAEERYNDFLESYPTIAARVPQHMLASYLGITPETVSRIRKNQSRRR